MKQFRTLITSALFGALLAASCVEPGSDAANELEALEMDEAAIFGKAGKIEVCFQNKVRKVNQAQADILVKLGGYRGACDVVVNRLSLGAGYIQSYVHLHEDGTPRAVGVQLDEAAMSGLPTEPHDGQTCWDLNGDGVTDPLAGECSGGHERILFYPKIEGLPFKFIQFNWQTFGHVPVHVFDSPHFDLHFFVQDYISRNFIRTGPCGTHIDCNDFEKAIKDVPAPFAPIGYSNVKAVAGRMGNHLLDLKDPVFNGGKLDHTFAFGSYDGHISYFEPVVLVSWLHGEKPSNCKPIPALPEVEVSGYYPREYCTRYRPDRKDYTMALEAFEYRTAPAGVEAPEEPEEPAEEPEDPGHDHMAPGH